MFGKICIIIMSCILITIIHETGHFLMSRKVGLHPILFRVGIGPVLFKKGILEITAFPFSGMVNHSEAEWDTICQQKQKMIALAGPAVNLIVGIATIYWMPFFGLLNLVVGFGNLIPVKTKRGQSDGRYMFSEVQPILRGTICCVFAVIVFLLYISCLVVII